MISMDALNTNLKENAIPEDIINMTVADYDEFLQVRRNKMAALIEMYYNVNGKLFSIDWGCGQNVGPNPLVYSPSRYT